MPPGGIRTHDLSRRAAADLHLRPRGHWDRPGLMIIQFKLGIPVSWYLNEMNEEMEAALCLAR